MLGVGQILLVISIGGWKHQSHKEYSGRICAPSSLQHKQSIVLRGPYSNTVWHHKWECPPNFTTAGLCHHVTICEYLSNKPRTFLFSSAFSESILFIFIMLSTISHVRRNINKDLMWHHLIQGTIVWRLINQSLISRWSVNIIASPSRDRPKQSRNTWLPTRPSHWTVRT